VSDSIAILLNTKNEKIIKAAFMLTTTVIENMEKNMDENTLCK